MYMKDHFSYARMIVSWRAASDYCSDIYLITPYKPRYHGRCKIFIIDGSLSREHRLKGTRKEW